MNHVFLADENMIVRGIETVEGRDFWRRIAVNCHHRLVLADVLTAKYYQKLNLPLKPLTPGFVQVLMGLIVNSEKVIIVNPAESTSLTTFVGDADDHFLVQIAAAAVEENQLDECILVSDDSATVDDFNGPELRSVGISAVTIPKALELADEGPS